MGKKFYAVAQGQNTGVYSDWDSCKSQVNGYSNAKYKSFATADMARAYVAENSRSSSSSSYSAPQSTSYSSPQYSSAPNYTSRESGSSQSEPAFHSIGYTRASNPVSSFPSSTSSKSPPAARTTVYTDGSSRGNGQTGASAGYGVYFGPNDSRNVSAPLTGKRQTNQRAELTAVVKALESVPSKESLSIKTDSQYSIDCFTKWNENWSRNGWKNSKQQDVENKDLIQRGLAIMDQRAGQTDFVKVQAHTGDPGNEMADRLANQGAMQPRS